MNILITGGAGFIGSNLTQRLLSKNHNVTILDNMNPQVHGNNYVTDSVSFQLLKKLKQDVQIVDLNNAISVLKKRYDIIYHLAAETGTNQSMYEISRYNKTNIDATIFLLNFYLQNVKYAPDKIILTSSRAVYGEALIDGNNIIASKEDDKLSPVSIYGLNKMYQEHLFKILLDCKINYTILRFQNVYGPYQSLHNSYTGVLNIISKQLLFDSDVSIFENGLPSRDFVYISDVVDSLILAINDNQNQTYNVGTGISTTILEVAQILKKLYQSNSNIATTLEKRNGDITHNVADLTKIKRDLNYSVKVELQHGLIEYSNWIKSLFVEAK